MSGSTSATFALRAADSRLILATYAGLPGLVFCIGACTAIWLPADAAILLGSVGMAGFVALIVWLFDGSRSVRIEMDGDGIRIRGDMWARFVPWRDVDAAAVRRLDLRRDRTLRPWLRMAGTGMFHYAAGWFRLRAGRTALVFLTDWRHAVYVPGVNASDLMVSPEDPDAFVAAVRRGRGALPG